MIYIIKGPAKSGKSTLANSLRNTAIATGKGALLIDEDNDGELAPLLEKIIFAASFVEGTPFKDIPWKEDPVIIFVNDGAKRLADFEAAVPGFTEGFGPVSTLATALN